MSVKGLTELNAALTRTVTAASTAGQRVVKRSETLFQQTAMQSYAEAHTAGTPTPSQPGEPPAVVTGTLRRSWTRTPPAPAGPFSWRGQVYPTAVYARIQELGGTAGRGGHTVLPARPVMQPTLDKVRAGLQQIHLEEFGRAIGA